MKVVEVAPIPSPYGALCQCELGLANHPGHVEVLPNPEAIAGFAGTGWVVKRKDPRFEFAEAVAALWTGKARGKHQLFRAIESLNQRGATTQFHSGLEGFGQALAQVSAAAKPVDHHVNVVLAVLFQGWHCVQFVDLAVNPRPHKPLGAQFLKAVEVLAFAPAHHRRQHHGPSALGQGDHLIDHLRDGLRIQRLAMARATWLPRTREQQPQVVVDLGDGADG